MVTTLSLVFVGLACGYALLVIAAAGYAFWSWLCASEARERACVALALASLAVGCAAPIHFSDSHAVWLASVKKDRF